MVFLRIASLASFLTFFSYSCIGEARSRGIDGSGCDGCHRPANDARLVLSPRSVSPGERVALQFTVHDPDARTAGVFIGFPSDESISAGTDMALVSRGASHVRPVAFEGGEATFTLDWNVPATPGAVRFVVAAVASNGDGRSGGDEALEETIDIVFGCEPVTFYLDRDGDGYGREAQSLGCVGNPPEGYAPLPDDCDDNSAEIYPGAPELCNRRDDNCNEEIDEDALPIELYPDRDGDGYSSSEERSSGDMVMGCLPFPGYADRSGDCDADDPLVNPGAEEVCDLFTDEDCDGRVDERVRPICGVGWCRRESFSCDLADCTPGDPVDEVCNFFDDDCDGEADEGDLCPAGQACLAGECRRGEGVVNSGSGGSSSPENPGEQGSPGGNEGCVFSVNRRGSSGLVLFFLMGLVAVRRRTRSLTVC